MNTARDGYGLGRQGVTNVIWGVEVANHGENRPRWPGSTKGITSKESVFLFVNSSAHLQNELNNLRSNHSSTSSKNSSFVLPQYIYTVAGLESSGTTLIAHLIRAAVNGVYRESYRDQFRDNHTVVRRANEVIHISLPTGSHCTDKEYREPFPIEPVIYPGRCVYNQSTKHPDNYRDEYQEPCSNLGGMPNVPYIYPPIPRFFVNLTSHLQWYRTYTPDVRSYLILVVRDPTISILSRTKNHCPNETLSVKETKLGHEIMREVMDTFLLNHDGVRQQVTTGRDNDNNHYDSRNSRFPQEPNALLSQNGVVLVSYEMLITYRDLYLKVLLRSLGIKEYSPRVSKIHISDGNYKYIREKEAE